MTEGLNEVEANEWRRKKTRDFFTEKYYCFPKEMYDEMEREFCYIAGTLGNLNMIEDQTIEILKNAFGKHPNPNYLPNFF